MPRSGSNRTCCEEGSTQGSPSSAARVGVEASGTCAQRYEGAFDGLYCLRTTGEEHHAEDQVEADSRSAMRQLRMASAPEKTSRNTFLAVQLGAHSRTTPAIASSNPCG